MKFARSGMSDFLSNDLKIQVGALSSAVLIAIVAPWFLGAQPAFAEPQPDGSAGVVDNSMIVHRYMIPTDGMIDRPKVRHLRRPTPRAKTSASTNASSDWLFDYVGRMLNTEPAAAKRHVGQVRKGVPAHPARPVVATSQPAETRVTQPQPLFSNTSAPISQPSPIATGALSSVVVPADPADAADQLVSAAEQTQLRHDLTKLEFAARTYDEQKMAGQPVFQSRDDWRVLERSRDALTDDERSSAMVAGFEANTYINEVTRTIVVAIAGTQDLKRDFLGADIWKALIEAQSPQHFYFAKTYVRSVIMRYQAKGYTTECVGHSLGGGACAYAASELGIRSLVVNPIAAGKLSAAARYLVTNYIVDGDIAHLVYAARGNEFPGETKIINDGRDAIRLMALAKYGQLAGPLLVVRELKAGIGSHRVDHALDLIAAQAEMPRPQ